jgi:DNA-binding LytR/AlgR family response regulator
MRRVMRPRQLPSWRAIPKSGGVADIQMPGTMDGIALARYVRKRWPPTIIVVSSGRAQPTAGVLAEEIPFLAKPYDDQRLSEIIGRVRERLAAA